MRYIKELPRLEEMPKDYFAEIIEAQRENLQLEKEIIEMMNQLNTDS